MSGSPYHYAFADDESDRHAFSFANTEFPRGYQRNACVHTVYGGSPAASLVPLEFQKSVLSTNNWPADTFTQTNALETAAQLDSFPPIPPIPLYTGGSYSPHSGCDASSGAHPLMSGHDSTVTMPSLIGYGRHSGGMIDAHRFYHDPSFHCIVDHLPVIPSPPPMPIVPTSLGVGAPGHADPGLLLESIVRQSPRHLPIATMAHLPSSYSTPSLSPSGSFDYESCPSPSTPLSFGNQSIVLSPSETSDQLEHHPFISTYLDPRYTFTVPLEDVELPLASSIEEVPFYRCLWGGTCNTWITCHDGSEKRHLISAHNAVLKGDADDSAASCLWPGCSSSLQRNGLLRHFHTHLGLRWLCSVCEGPFSRPDSVKLHARKVPKCQLAQAIGYPSALAYRAKKNGDNTVTLIKILQP